MSVVRYPFQNKQIYRFDYRGQGRSIAVTTPGNVHVVPTIPLNKYQLWIAEKDEDSGEFRFHNNADTNPYLEK